MSEFAKGYCSWLLMRMTTIVVVATIGLSLLF